MQNQDFAERERKKFIIEQKLRQDPRHSHVAADVILALSILLAAGYACAALQGVI